LLRRGDGVARYLALIGLALPGTAGGTGIPSPGPLDPAEARRLRICVEAGLLTLQPVLEGRTTRMGIDCPKASLPGCDPRTESRTLRLEASPRHVIVSARSWRVKAEHAREVNITVATHTATAASAVLSCRGWGCDPGKGGSPGEGFLAVTERRVASREEIASVVLACSRSHLSER
jgi:hypothetical protein